MSVSIKTAQEIELMRESGHLLEKVHDGLIPYIKPGMSTKEIDRIGEDMIRSMGCIPNFLNYGGFPGSFCISLNDEVVHGIPSEDKIIQDGDLVKIDAGLIYKGYHSDAARTYAVGEVSKEAKQLMEIISMIFPRQSERMRRNTVMVLYEIWWDMGLVLIFTKIRRFPTSLRNAGE